MDENRLILHSKPTIEESDELAVIDILRSAHLEAGEKVAELENWFSKTYNVKYACAVSTGFAAIHLSLMALSINKGDEVIIPSYSCAALLNPVKLLGATPVVVDVGLNSFNISVDEITKKITKKTKAIIVPHIFGFPAQIDAICKLGIPIIEDCAQAVGGTYKEKTLGRFGDLSIFSFYASKMITSGDGGMIITDNPAYYKIIENYRYYGHKKLHRFDAYNYHLTNLPAALAASQMSRIDLFISKRKEIAKLYDHHFSGIDRIHINFEQRKDSCFYRYPVQINMDIEIVKLKMLEKGIQCGYGVLDGMHQVLRLPAGDYPNTEKLLKSVLSLPIYPTLTNKEVFYIADTLIDIIKNI